MTRVCYNKNIFYKKISFHIFMHIVNMSNIASKYEKDTLQALGGVYFTKNALIAITQIYSASMKSYQEKNV